MIRKYVRKTNRANWSETTLKKAIKACKKLSVRAAGIKYGIPHGTLHRHLKREANGEETRHLGQSSVFNEQLEEELVDYAKRMTDTYFGISLRDLRKLAYDFAERHRLNHPFKGNSAGENWSSHFLEDHPDIEIRSLKGPRVYDSLKVSSFFERLSSVVKQHYIDVNDIYNVDEIGIVSYDGKDPEVMRLSAGMQVETIFQNDGQIVSAICCYNVTGHFLPPTFVFSCEQIGKNDDLLKRVPFPSTLALFSDDGWTNREVFVDWLSFFIQRVRPSKQNKVLLLIDNDEAHVSLAAYDYAIEHGVVMLSVPAYSSEIILPIHFSIFACICTNFSDALHDWKRRNPGSTIVEAQIAALFGRAYMKSCSVSSAFESFEQSKIYPLKDTIGDRLETYEQITAEDEQHLIDALYQNGHYTDTKETIPKINNVVMRKRHRKSTPRRCRTRKTNYVEDNESLYDSS